MLQEKHDNTIKNIQELQELEKYMFQNPIKINEQNCVAVFHGEPKPFNCGDKFVEENWR